ncbi:MAG: 4-hydroxy-tetrahydrodipicolinate reductase [Parasphingorhabdus sp.]|jgi:4-hydroxy-tetrahydrodipicolinate reductase
MINLAIAGAAGRMGRMLVAACQQDDSVQVTHAIEVSGNPVIGQDCGDLSGVGTLGVAIDAELNPAKFDILIEFTNPASTLEHLEFCRQNYKSMVIGTTGLGKDDIKTLQDAAQSIPIVFAPNMSVGVNLTLKLLEMAARALGTDADVEVIEAHHRHKVDAPSGTALRLGEAVAEAWGKDLQEIGVFERHGQIGPRPDGSIGFSTIRAGEIVGEHTVMFATDGEILEITHKSVSRMNFANGAVRAARWLHGRPAGLFSMQDVLDLSK